VASWEPARIAKTLRGTSSASYAVTAKTGSNAPASCEARDAASLQEAGRWTERLTCPFYQDPNVAEPVVTNLLAECSQGPIMSMEDTAAGRLHAILLDLRRSTSGHPARALPEVPGHGVGLHMRGPEVST
jgi:hypothetical protein